MSHPRERLSAFLDGELARSERSEIEGHLRGCAECARALEDLSTVDTLARGLSVDAPAGYFDALPARVRARVQARGRRRAWMPAAWAAGAAAAAAVLVAVVAPPTLRRAAEPPAERAAASVQSAPVPPPSEAARDHAVAEMQETPTGAADAAGRAQAPFPAPAQAKQADKGAAPGKDAVLSRLEARERAAVAKEQAPRAADRLKAEDTLAEPRPAAPATETAAANRAVAAPAGAAAGAMAAAPPPAPASPPETVVAQAQADEETAARKAAPAPRAGLAGGREHKLSAPGRVYPPPDPARLVEERYQSLLDQRPATAADARALRDGWDAFVRDQPSGPHADEARVRAIEAGAAAWRLGGETSDRERARAAAQAYLALESAPQRARVQAVLDALPPQP